MRTITKTVYLFHELSDEAQEKAIQNFSDANVNYAWWGSVYEDAERIGLRITGFDIDRGSYVKGEFIDSARDTAEAIVKEHGKSCETHKDAAKFLQDWDALVTKYSDGVNTAEVSEENEYEFDNEADEIEEEFRKTLCEDYRLILQKEYDFLTSRESVVETIEANGYEFDENGNF